MYVHITSTFIKPYTNLDECCEKFEKKRKDENCEKKLTIKNREDIS